jgi:hypothetical protein
MKDILFRNSLVGMLAVFALHAQSPNSTTATSSARYSVTGLGTLGGSFSAAFGINSAGRLGGAAARPDGNVHAFLSGTGGTRRKAV